jgi:dihydrofolate synthase/folylpolyglutamate synthase
MTPADALLKIDALDKFGIDLGVERIKACLKALGNPQYLYKTLHVGGTNG